MSTVSIAGCSASQFRRGAHSRDANLNKAAKAPAAAAAISKTPKKAEKAMIIKSALVGLVATLCGCATIISGRTQKVSINTVPPGASVKIDGSDRGTTPLVIILPRRPSHTLALQKDGYSPQNYVINSGFNGWFLGNILLGGVIGMIVDGSTGASSKLEVPNDGNYVLAPVQPPPVSRNH